MKIYYIANVRMPGEKAYGIQIAKMCEALIEEGADVTLVVPARGTRQPLREFYGLRVEVPTVWLPSLALRRYKRFGYFLMSVSFCVSCLPFLWLKRLRGEKFVLYTVDVDRYSSSALALVQAPLFSEMHGAKPRTWVQRVLFARVRGIIAINAIIVQELKDTFRSSRARYIVEPNGVDLEAFAPYSKTAARTALSLPADAAIVLYAGRFYDWKGLEILPRAATLTPQMRWQMVGGTQSEFAALAGELLPENMHFAGGRPHGEMPLWIAAADAVVVLGTKRDEQSYRWTSPMKLFEYMAAGRPIVAADTPALREIVSHKKALLYEPDNAQDLANKTLLAAGQGMEDKVAAASRAVLGHTWGARARRVLHFIDSNIHEPIP